jgi:hypothetical protein
MNRRFLVPVVFSALLAVTTVSSVFAGSGVAFRDTAHGAPNRDLVIQPGTDPSSVQLHFAGAQRVTYSRTGVLEIVNTDGHAWHYRPEVYQIVNGKRKLVSVAFGFVGRDRVTLRLTRYDPSEPLIVTPVSGPAKGM